MLPGPACGSTRPERPHLPRGPEPVQTAPEAGWEGGTRNRPAERHAGIHSAPRLSSATTQAGLEAVPKPDLDDRVVSALDPACRLEPQRRRGSWPGPAHTDSARTTVS